MQHHGAAHPVKKPIELFGLGWPTPIPKNCPAGNPAPAVKGIVDPAVSLMDFMPATWTAPLPLGTPNVKRRWLASPLHSNRNVAVPTPSGTEISDDEPFDMVTSMRVAPGPGGPGAAVGPPLAGRVLACEAAAEPRLPARLRRR